METVNNNMDSFLVILKCINVTVFWQNIHWFQGKAAANANDFNKEINIATYYTKQTI